MKILLSAIVLAILFASTEAIKIEPVSLVERHHNKDGHYAKKVIGEAMKKFVAKHEEIATRHTN